MSAFYEKGLYRVEFVNQQLGQAQTGTPQFVIRFRVLGIYGNDGEVHPVDEYERNAFLYITEKTMPFFTENLETLGLRIESFKELDPSHPRAAVLRGEGDMWCNIETDKKNPNETREKWGVPKGVFDVVPLSPSEAGKLDNMFGAALKKASANKPKPTAAKPGPVAIADGISNDDVPF